MFPRLLLCKWVSLILDWVLSWQLLLRISTRISGGQIDNKQRAAERCYGHNWGSTFKETSLLTRVFQRDLVTVKAQASDKSLSSCFLYDLSQTIWDNVLFSIQNVSLLHQRSQIVTVVWDAQWLTRVQIHHDVFYLRVSAFSSVPACLMNLKINVRDTQKQFLRKTSITYNCFMSEDFYIGLMNFLYI